MRLRSLLYSAVVLYLILDVAVLKGPLWRYFNRQGTPPAHLRPVAVVGHNVITRSHLDHAVTVYLHQRGKTANGLDATQLRNTRLAVLHELIDYEVVRHRAELTPVEVAPEQIRREKSNLLRTFADKDAATEALRDAGLTLTELENRIDAEEHVSAWIEDKISHRLRVPEEEAQTWYDDHRDDLRLPPIFEARHIFLSTVKEDTPAKEKTIRGLYEKITGGATDFADAAAEFSDDESTRDKGGTLPLFSHRRMPADFMAALDGHEAGDVIPPFRTKLGWHLVEIIRRLPSRLPAFTEMKQEIQAHLRNKHRRQAVESLTRELRQGAGVKLFLDGL